MTNIVSFDYHSHTNTNFTFEMLHEILTTLIFFITLVTVQTRQKAFALYPMLSIDSKMGGVKLFIWPNCFN